MARKAGDEGNPGGGTAAVTQTQEKAAADLWKKWDREVLESYQRGWEYDGPTPKELIYVAAEHFRSRYGEGAA